MMQPERQESSSAITATDMEAGEAKFSSTGIHGVGITDNPTEGSLPEDASDDAAMLRCHVAGAEEEVANLPPCTRWVGAVLLPICCLITSPLLLLALLAKPIRVLRSICAEALGVRLLVSSNYPDLRLSLYTLKSSLGLSLINEVEYLSLSYLLDERVKKCWFDTLQTLLLVSGLLTTSSYQAFYGEARKDTPFATLNQTAT